jgi:hypothetical protein
MSPLQRLSPLDLLGFIAYQWAVSGGRPDPQAVESAAALLLEGRESSTWREPAAKAQMPNGDSLLSERELAEAIAAASR